MCVCHSPRAVYSNLQQLLPSKNDDGCMYFNDYCPCLGCLCFPSPWPPSWMHDMTHGLTGRTLPRSYSQDDTWPVPLASLAKLRCLPCLSSASPTNQELIEAARSSCCYSNKQHCLFNPPSKTWIWHSRSRGLLRPSPSEFLHTPTLFIHPLSFADRAAFWEKRRNLSSWWATKLFNKMLRS